MDLHPDPSKAKSLSEEFKIRYQVDLGSLKTEHDFADAAVFVTNGFYESSENLKNHLSYLFILASKRLPK